MPLSCTYCPLENKLRLYSTSRLDAETYARVKAAGFRFAPKQECFYAPAWSPEREDLLLDLCGEIGDEDSTLVDRAAVRAERFEDYSEKRGSEAEQARASIQHIMDGIPTGQPILRAHHSFKHAMKDKERIESGMRKAVSLWQTSQYWQERAKGALRHAKYKERPDVRARRIKTLEAELRKVQRTKDDAEKFTRLWLKEPLSYIDARNIANYDHVSQCFPLEDYPRESPVSLYEGMMGLWSALDGIITPEQARALAVAAHARTLGMAERWIEHLNNRLTYERTLLQDAGGTEADQTKPEVGGAVRSWVSRHHAEWLTIQKVNKVSVSLLDNWSDGGSNFHRTVPFDKLHGLMSLAEVTAKRDAGLIKDNGHSTGFFLLDTPPPTPTLQPSVPDDSIFKTMKNTLKAGIQVAVVDQLFPTPPDLAARMVQRVNLQPGELVLEPSAGTGNLLNAVSCVHEDAILAAVEINPALCARLQSQGHNVTQQDFLTCTPEQFHPFDVVLMNPPFQDAQDIAHCTHAIKFLAPGGRLVAILSAGVSFRTDKAHTAFRALLDSHNATIEPLPTDTFKDSGTSVNTVLVSLSLPPSVPTRPQDHAEPLVSQAMGLSTGTLSTCTGLGTYTELDAIREAFIRWCNVHPVYTTWQDAWHIFWAAHTPDTCPWPAVTPETGQPSVPVTPLETLAASIADAGAQEAKHRQCARMSKELTGKKQSSKTQVAPGGMFAKEQLKLF